MNINETITMYIPYELGLLLASSELRTALKIRKNTDTAGNKSKIK